MNTSCLPTRRLPACATALEAALVMALALPLSPALADDKAPQPAFPAPAAKTGEAPAMSEIPTMRAQGERMAVLMEKLTKESDPEERRRIMAEAMCPQ